MNAMEWIIVGMVAAALVMGLIVEIKIILRHNQRTIEAIAAIPGDLRNHISNTATMVNNSVKNVEGKVDKMAAAAAVTVEAKKKEVSDYLDRIKASL